MVTGFDLLFYIFAIAIIMSAVGVVLARNPIHSALYLAITMVFLGFMFFHLDAEFIAWVQLIVYAGAVMVLFVMVVMLFDLSDAEEPYSKGRFTGFLKIAGAAWLCGWVSKVVVMSTDMVVTSPVEASAAGMGTKALATKLFTKYVLAFEALGILLLLIAIGAVAVSRIKGGTHAR